jgi:malonyl CoA-acyl carrier protein transacylase
MRSVYVFPGQGSQHKGMGAGLFEKFPELVAQADDVLGYSIEDLCLRDPDRVLSRTQYTQPALYVVNSLTYLDRTTERGELPAAVAGHSLGEYCALFAAGAFDFATGLRLVAERGELMSRAPKGAMAAVVNLDEERVREVLAGLPFRNIDIANINARTQCILSGEYDELHDPELRAAYTEAGARFVPLNVSAAFHSRCMTTVQQEFALYLAGFDLAELTLPVVANYTARPYPAKGYADHLAHQISSSVRWYESMSWLIAQGYRDFHEIGPGNVLTKLSAQILKDPLPVGTGPAPQRVPATVAAMYSPSRPAPAPNWSSCTAARAPSTTRWAGACTTPSRCSATPWTAATRPTARWPAPRSWPPSTTTRARAAPWTTSSSRTRRSTASATASPRCSAPRASTPTRCSDTASASTSRPRWRAPCPSRTACGS